MKLFALSVALCVAPAASWALSGSKGTHLDTVSSQDVAGCIANAEQFMKSPHKKGRAIERAMDHCAMDKKVDDKNFVCPHYRDILTAAFARESTTKEFTAKSFCEVAEGYVSELRSAAKIPNMGKGAGFSFELSKNCKPTVQASFAKDQKKLPAKSAPDFWYALCMNQDCAHFLPSRTRWCTHDHQPTHTASVCEAVRTFAQDEVFIMEKNLGHELDSEQMCSIYDDFVQASHINAEAYMHVVHGTSDHPVPSPANQKRALDSAKMKNKASHNELRDGAGAPVKSATTSTVPALALVSFASLGALLQ
jgi:hypothetical protein